MHVKLFLVRTVASQKNILIYQLTTNPLATARANKLARNFLAINHQLLDLESCSNPLRIQQAF